MVVRLRKVEAIQRVCKLVRVLQCRKLAFNRLKLDELSGSLPKSDPLDFATKNTFPLFFVGEEALVGIY